MTEEAGVPPKPNDDEETTTVLNIVRALLASLETLSGIETYEIAIPGMTQRWQEAMRTGEQTLNKLQGLIEEWEIEFERHHYRAEDALDALGLLDQEEDTEEKDEEDHE